MGARNMQFEARVAQPREAPAACLASRHKRASCAMHDGNLLSAAMVFCKWQAASSWSPAWQPRYWVIECGVLGGGTTSAAVDGTVLLTGGCRD